MLAECMFGTKKLLFAHQKMTWRIRNSKDNKCQKYFSNGGGERYIGIEQDQICFSFTNRRKQSHWYYLWNSLKFLHVQIGMLCVTADSQMTLA